MYIERYRLGLDIDEKILTFIKNCDDNTIRKDIIRDGRINEILDIDEEINDSLSHIDEFLNDFDKSIKFTESPVFMVPVSSVDEYDSRYKIEFKHCRVNTYEFDEYNDMKKFIINESENGNKVFVFTYKITNNFDGMCTGPYIHLLRCSMVNKNELYNEF